MTGGSSPGQQVGAYRLLRLLGKGGMGEVYLALDTRLGRKVAIKFLSASTLDDEQGRRRLLREARAAATLDHPNICAIHEVGEENGRSFIVMQYVEGETLADVLQRKGLDVNEVLGAAIQIADALADAHAHNIIHRDIKPANIIIDSRGQTKVLDFGLAKLLPALTEEEGYAATASIVSVAGLVAAPCPTCRLNKHAVRRWMDARIFSVSACCCMRVERATAVHAPQHAGNSLRGPDARAALARLHRAGYAARVATHRCALSGEG